VRAARRKCRACGQLKAATAYAKGRTYCKACCTPKAVAARKLVRARKARSSEVARDSRIRRTYELEPEEYDAILAAQGFACAICRRKPRSRKLQVDHDHLIEKVHGVRKSLRGLLCGQCNGRLLRACGHDPDVLRRAAAYLEDPPARVVLHTA
jgi:hypothetical protein